jgi:hypothetical protein
MFVSCHTLQPRICRWYVSPKRQLTHPSYSCAYVRCGSSRREWRGMLRSGVVLLENAPHP